MSSWKTFSPTPSHSHRHILQLLQSSSAMLASRCNRTQKVPLLSHQSTDYLEVSEIIQMSEAFSLSLDFPENLVKS